VQGDSESAYPAALWRRSLTVPVLYIAFVVVLALSPVLVLVAGTVDGVRAARGWPTIRLVGFLIAYLGYEVAGVSRAGWIWISQPLARTDWLERNHRLQIWWTRSLVRAAGPILGLRLEVEFVGPVRPGPLVAVARHVSIVDALLPAQVLGVGEDLRLRYVLTRGLRLDPCLDIAGHRLPNHFINRSGSDPAAEIADLERLGSGMGDDEVAVIFPEGGLFTPERRERALRHVEATDSARAPTARRLHHLLLPRPSGTLALLRAAPDADVLVIGHQGFEPLGSLKRLWRTLPLVEPVRLRVERHDRASVPLDDPGRVAWLDEQWLTMDRWLATGPDGDDPDDVDGADGGGRRAVPATIAVTTDRGGRPG
jgi:hypothetical protein